MWQHSFSRRRPIIQRGLRCGRSGIRSRSLCLDAKQEKQQEKKSDASEGNHRRRHGSIAAERKQSGNKDALQFQWSADLQSAYRSKTEISLTAQSRLQIGAPTGMIPRPKSFKKFVGFRPGRR
jgi:hypothetical protein